MLIHRLNKTMRRALADKLIGMALGGNFNAISYIYDRIEGKPRQMVVNQTQGEHPVIAIFQKLLDDNTALEGHRVVGRPGGYDLPARTVVDAEVREVSSRSTGAEVQ